MKKMMQWISPVLFFSLFALSAQADVNPGTGVSFVVKPLEGAKAMVRVFNATEGSLSFVVRDADGNVLYSDVITKDASLFRKLNFSKLANGKYELTVAGRSQSVKQAFAVVEGTVLFDQNPLSDFFQPSIIQKDDNLVFRLANSSESAIFRIWDNLGRVVYEETVEQNTVGKIYNLSKLPKGKYTASISSGVKFFEKSFSL